VQEIIVLVFMVVIVFAECLLGQIDNIDVDVAGETVEISAAILVMCSEESP